MKQIDDQLVEKVLKYNDLECFRYGLCCSIGYQLITNKIILYHEIS